MRVLHLIPTMAGGGAERQLAYLAAGLRALGCDIHAGILEGGVNLSRLAAAGATVHRLEARGNYDPRIFFSIVRLIRTIQPDVVQTWLTQMDVFGGAAALVTRTPWIISERTSGAHYPRTIRFFLRSALGRKAAAVVANSEAGLDCWQHTTGRRFIVRNAVPFEDIESVPPAAGDFGTAKLVLFAGRMGEEKNVANLIAALGEVIAQRDVVALLCGSGPLEEEIRALIARSQAGGRIRMLGFCENLPSLMKRADLLVAPSWFEGHPNVSIEAAAAGCPLVVSDIPAHRSWLSEGAALFVSPEDSHALATAILRTLDDPRAARERAARARELVSGWSIPSAAATYLRIYEEIRSTRKERA